MLKIILLIVLAISLHVNALPRGNKYLSILRHDGRIVGGHPIEISEAPWSVSIWYTYSSIGTIHYCGGTIVNSKVVLTAAHCLYDLEVDPMYVRVGSANNQAGGQIIRDIQFVMHELYNDDLYQYDIGLIFLSTPITYPGAAPILLPVQGAPVAEGSVAINTGWGELTNGSNPSMLQSVETQIANHDYCKEKNEFIAEVTDYMICAAVPGGGKGSCFGDSGGPLTVDNVQVGITVWAFGCAIDTYPTVYTRVSYFIDWINSTIEAQKHK